MSKAHPSLGDPGDEVEYYPLHPFQPVPDELPPVIRVKVPPAEIPNIFAHRQWRAGMLMSDFIYADILQLDHCDILELGAGTGLPSISAHLYSKARSVVATDYDSLSLIHTLKLNIESNKSSRPKSSISAAGHTWAKAIDDIKDLVPGETFDTILLADCIWDELSHTALLKSVTSLLRKDTRSKVLMVSGLHTGRTKIVSFIRRAHRQGLHLVAFPTNDSLEWPSLSQSEMEVQERQSQIYSSDEALTEASYFIIEMQVLSHESEEASINDTTNSSRVWVAKTPRLSNTRRTFVVHDREEESDDTKDSIHVRNRWITFMALAWQ